MTDMKLMRERARHGLISEGEIAYLIDALEELFEGMWEDAESPCMGGPRCEPRLARHGGERRS